MRIGTLARKYNLTIDTIRYYMELGLLIPQKSGAQYAFSAREEEVLAFIQKLKLMGFGLKEIEKIIALYRTSNWVEPHTMQSYEQYLREKIGELNAREAAIQHSVSLIRKELESLPQKAMPSTPSEGVPLRAIPLLYCPDCSLPLTVENGTLQNRYITAGHLKCPKCDYRAKIENGILITRNRYTGQYDSPDMERKLYQSFNTDLIKGYQQASDAMLRGLQKVVHSEKVILESFVNGYFFLYTHFHELPQDAIYTIIDKYPETLNMYRQLITAVAPDVDILYLADASMKYPLKHGCIDILADFFTINEHDLYFSESYYDQMLPYMSDEVSIIGTYMSLPPNARSRKQYALKYPECSSEICDFKKVEKVLLENSFRVTQKTLYVLNKTPNQYSFACHINGEELRLIYYEALKASSA